MLKEIIINNWSGGLSDSKVMGVKGSFYEGVGLDIHSNPYLLTVNQKLKKESGTTVTDLCYFSVPASDGSSYWFGNAGKIYKRTSAGVWSNVYTDGSSRPILGAAEYNGYLYWATTTKLHRKPFPGLANWSDAAVDWATLDSATWHQMTVQGLYLVICNATKIATVDDTGTFTASGTPDVTVVALPPTFQYTSIRNYGIDVLLGAKTTDSYTSARTFRWDLSSDTYVADDDIQEYGVNTFIPADNDMYVSAGGVGNFYLYSGDKLYLRKRLKGDYAAKTMVINPDSVTSFRGLSMFGVSNNSSNPVSQGIYSLGRYDNNYPLALNLEYPISTGNLTGITIGSVKTIGNDILVAWKDTTGGTAYGVDVIDWSNKYTSAYIKTLTLGGKRQYEKDYQEYSIGYLSLPTSTDLSLKVSINEGTEDSITLESDATDTVSAYREHAKSTKSGGTIHLRVDFTVSGNNAPVVDQMYCLYDEKSIP